MRMSLTFSGFYRNLEAKNVCGGSDTLVLKKRTSNGNDSLSLSGRFLGVGVECACIYMLRR